MTPTREQLEKAKAWLDHRVKVATATPYLSLTDAMTLQGAVEVAIDALPKTKMVEVWRVEWALNDFPVLHQHLSEADARANAKLLKEEAHRTCIRVTGPHMQEVPE